jgi:hypothetical protein
MLDTPGSRRSRRSAYSAAGEVKAYYRRPEHRSGIAEMIFGLFRGGVGGEF